MTEEKQGVKEGLIGIQEASTYLNCSPQALAKILKQEEFHVLQLFFRHYAGRYRTTYNLLDEYFTEAILKG